MARGSSIINLTIYGDLRNLRKCPLCGCRLKKPCKSCKITQKSFCPYTTGKNRISAHIHCFKKQPKPMQKLMMIWANKEHTSE